MNNAEQIGTVLLNTNNVDSDSGEYDRLVWRVKYLHGRAMTTLTGDKDGIPSVTANLRDVGRSLSWRVEDWAKASYTLQWCDWTIAQLEKAALEAADTFRYGGDIEDVCAFWNQAAESIKRKVAAEALNTTLRGPETSSNPMTIIDSKAKVDTAREMLESICGLSIYQIASFDAVNDLFDGVQRREEERRKAQLKIISKVVYFKRDGYYHAEAINSEGDMLHRCGWSGVKRKAEGKARAEEWASGLNDVMRGPSIPVEAR